MNPRQATDLEGPKSHGLSTWISSRLFWSSFLSVGALYALLIVAMLVAQLQFLTIDQFLSNLASPSVRFSLGLSLVTSTASALIALWVAVPTAYWLERLSQDSENLKPETWTARTIRSVLELLFDVPIVLPPLVVGICLLILFQTSAGRWADQAFGSVMEAIGLGGMQGITYEIPAIILAQSTVACAFAIRSMRESFRRLNPRHRQLAATLGASDSQIFWEIDFPQSWSGTMAAFSLAWAKSVGEFGPVLVFAGTPRFKTEVLPSTVYLSFQSGDLTAAVSASILLLLLSLIVLVPVRVFSYPPID